MKAAPQTEQLPMIRKAVIVVLTLGAAHTAYVWILVSLVSASPAFTGGSTFYVRRILGQQNIRLSNAYWLPMLDWFQGSLFLTLPFWIVVVGLLAYPTIAFMRGPLRRWRRRRKGLCQNCGYNLTGNVTGVCSECGTKIERESTA